MKTEHYVAAHKDENILKVSSSGGVFSAVAEYVFSKNGVAFGAAFDPKEKRVIHKCADCFEKIADMRKSKYVWSDYTQCFAELEKAISCGKTVLFTGTPCQCAAVRKKYGEHGNLIILDFYCHATGESDIFKEYLETCLPDCERIDFRGQAENADFNFVFNAWNAQGEKILSERSHDNIYYQLYINSAAVRQACFKCPFSVKRHVSDITMGDFEYKDMAVRYGITVKHPSVLSVNTQKGKEILGELGGSLDFKRLGDDDSEKMSYYYRNHADVKGKWGYNDEIKASFKEDYGKYGFLKAAYKSVYPAECAPLFAAQGKMWRDVWLYGAGKVGRFTKRIIENAFENFNVKGFVVTQKDEPFVGSVRVCDVRELYSENPKANIIVCVVEKKKEEIYGQIKKLGFKNYI